MALVRPSPSEASLYNFGVPERIAYLIDAFRGFSGQAAQASNFRGSSLAAAQQDAAVAFAVPCVLNGYDMGNTAAYWVYVKFYNVANPTSASTPVRRVALPPGGGISRSGLSQGFDTVMWTRCTKGLADNDATACLSGDVTFSIDATPS